MSKRKGVRGAAGIVCRRWQRPARLATYSLKETRPGIARPATDGNALWYSYDYSIDAPKEHVAGDPPGIGAKGLSTLPAALNAVVGNNPCYLATSAQVHKLTRARPLLICVVQH